MRGGPLRRSISPCSSTRFFPWVATGKAVCGSAVRAAWRGLTARIFPTSPPSRASRPALSSPCIQRPRGLFCSAYTAGAILAVHQARDGSLWFGTDGSGVARATRTGDSYTFTKLSTDDGLLHNRVSGIAEDSQRNLWFACGPDQPAPDQHGGVCRYDGASFVTYSTADGLAGNTVQALHVDADDNVWIATTEGLSRLQPQAMLTYSPSDGLDAGPVRDLAFSADGNVWCIIGERVSRFDGRRWIKGTVEQGLADTSPRSFFRDKDGTLFLTDANATVVRSQPGGGEAGVPPRFEPVAENVTAFALARSATGELWLAGPQGVRRETDTDRKSTPLQSTH